ncbi:DsrE family protein [Clostridium polynesiense]|uniref:DsrE family protein n=1 Tax=Clostridium polynesiense TaxID=1325933 RepID=UPI00058B9654|nr:DsrE family protein [Clostridium polynesiense]
MSDNFNYPAGNPAHHPGIIPGAIGDGVTPANDKAPEIYTDNTVSEVKPKDITNNYNVSHKYKAILHVHDASKWDNALTSAKTIYDILGIQNVHLVFLATGDAVKTLIDKDKANTDFMDSIKASLAYNNEDNVVDILALASSGAEFKACGESLAEYKIDAPKLFNYVNIVPTAAVELIVKQNQGYAYLLY